MDKSALKALYTKAAAGAFAGASIAALTFWFVR